MSNPELCNQNGECPASEFQEVPNPSQRACTSSGNRPRSRCKHKELLLRTCASAGSQAQSEREREVLVLELLMLDLSRSVLLETG